MTECVGDSIDVAAANNDTNGLFQAAMELERAEDLQLVLLRLLGPAEPNCGRRGLANEIDGSASMAEQIVPVTRGKRDRMPPPLPTSVRSQSAASALGALDMSCRFCLEEGEAAILERLDATTGSTADHSTAGRLALAAPMTM